MGNLDLYLFDKICNMNLLKENSRIFLGLFEKLDCIYIEMENINLDTKL